MSKVTKLSCKFRLTNGYRLFIGANVRLAVCVILIIVMVFPNMEPFRSVGVRKSARSCFSVPMGWGPVMGSSILTLGCGH